MKRLFANVAYHIRKLRYPKTASGQRSKINNVLFKSGSKGMTRDEIVVRTGIPLQSVTWRVRELIKARQVVCFDNEVRPTRLGYMACVLYSVKYIEVDPLGSAGLRFG